MSRVKGEVVAGGEMLSVYGRKSLWLGATVSTDVPSCSRGSASLPCTAPLLAFPRTWFLPSFTFLSLLDLPFPKSML